MLNLETRCRSQEGYSGPSIGQIVHVTGDLNLPGFTTRFGRDEEIFGEGEHAEYVYKVISGVVRTHRVLEDGRRQISSFHYTGDVFGLEFNEGHSASAEAVTDCEIALVRSTALKRMVAKNPTAACEMLALASRDLGRAREHLVALGRKTALERVVDFLLDLAGREAGNKTVNVPMTRIDIADYLGLTIETVSRTLSLLERTGAIAILSCRQLVLRNRDLLLGTNSYSSTSGNIPTS